MTELDIVHSWDAVGPGLARTFRVFTYDRRGHSQSERLPTQGSIEHGGPLSGKHRRGEPPPKTGVCQARA
jgi:hypothetical protein